MRCLLTTISSYRYNPNPTIPSGVRVEVFAPAPSSSMTISIGPDLGGGPWSKKKGIVMLVDAMGATQRRRW